MVDQWWIKGFLVPASVLADFAAQIIEDNQNETLRLIMADAVQELGFPNCEKMADGLRKRGTWWIMCGPYKKGWVPRLVWKPLEGGPMVVVAGVKRSKLPKCVRCGHPLILTRGDRFNMHTGILTRSGGWVSAFWRCAAFLDCNARYTRNRKKQRRKENKARLRKELAEFEAEEAKYGLVDGLYEPEEL